MKTRPTRRGFLQAAAGAAVAMNASSYARVVGANDRIGVGQLGCGERGRTAHMPGLHAHEKAHNVEYRAVCDVWRVAREEAAGMVQNWNGAAPKQYVSHEDLVNDPDIDAVMIATCDHQHVRHLEDTARAGRDAYCEKPLAKDMESLNRVCDVVRESGILVQIGTQSRSLPSMAGAREAYRKGLLGKVGRIEHMRNELRPYWLTQLKEARAEDVDWQRFLMGRPDRPFSAAQLTGWYGFREFSDGPVPTYGSHFVDLVHYITGTTFPVSAVCLGRDSEGHEGVPFDCPEQVQAVWTYPEGFLVCYSTGFGNYSGSGFSLYGDQAAMNLWEGEDVYLYRRGALNSGGKPEDQIRVEDVPVPDHLVDWLQCIRSRKTPNAPMEAGYQHAVAVIMAMKAYDTGRRQVFDPGKREIREG
ncbi:MAG TPA: Gfo/Idh/MocA family oxidoreductase [Candidatus Hydrogenedentes bacterium]|nr:Gfo/Idh/MocA family oxidoreductase [Candidatus Hydrogenedentota bacterium]